MVRKMCVVAVVLAAVLCGSVIRAQETKAENSYQLRYKFNQGDRWMEVVSLTQLSSSNDEAMGAMLSSDSNREVTYLNEVNSVAKDGTASISVTVKKIKVKSTQAGATVMNYDSDGDPEKNKSSIPMIQNAIDEMAKSVGAKFTIKVNNLGKILDVKAEGNANPEFGNIPRLNFPKEPLKKGEKWSYESSLSQINPIMASVKINCVLDSIEGSNAVVKSDIDISGKSSEGMKGSDSKGTGTIYFDTKDGRMTKMLLSVAYENVMSAMGKEIKLNMKAGLNVESKSADASEGKKEKKDKAEF